MPKIKRLAISLAAAAGILTPLAVQATPAQARHSQVAMFEADSDLLTNAQGTMKTLQKLGVGIIRLNISWSGLAPNPLSTTKPKFNDRNSASYPAAGWSGYDQVMNAAKQDHIQVDLLISGGMPFWAASHPIPSEARNRFYAWKPQAKLYGNFVYAVASRYHKSVSTYELFNEPNFGQDLTPQGEHGNLEAATYYRGMVDSGYSSLRSLHVSGSKIIIGNLSARGQAVPGEFDQTPPLSFVRGLYCVDTRFRALRGSAATRIGCPSHPSKSFAKQHPALFATSFGIHPYPQGLAPTRDASNNPDFVTFNKLRNLERTLDGVNRAYGSHHRADIYNNEYGYVTHPPNTDHQFASPAQAAAYINEAEYLSWGDGRIASTMQFLLRDPSEAEARNPHASHFYSGIESSHGTPKATYNAYRLPLWLPSSSTRRGSRLTVWGDVRPAHVYSGTQYAYIQFQRGSHGGYTNLTKLKITDPRGYFDVKVAFPVSGHVRVAWKYPGGSTVYSRTQSVSIR